VQLRLVIFANDGRGARNLSLGAGSMLGAAVVLLGAVASVLWVGWKIGELTARF
jgi:hypothetical protein